ncbi:MAG: bifunctional hydroxymethylpyrimidine kinase/phosphomethylpyrimidine kinase [Acidimicrobiia bacterium]|nr:bifunctional hydroxymethylpyrimidine kinase/phosphomethylpyrimidine kinase [Acidimicrobiia bacterium]
MRPVALSIAGSDSGGGAGIEADLKTFEAHGVWGTAAVTAVTAQNSLGVQASEGVPPELVRAQMASVAADIGVDAAKTGMLVDAPTLTTVVETVRQLGISPLVVDPVLVSSHGDTLLDLDGVDALRELLLPLATIVTPNLAEAAALANQAVDSRESMQEAATLISDLGPPVVLVTGGHLAGDQSPDCLFVEGDVTWLDAPRLAAVHTHGSGCVLSAAVCAGLAKGMDPADACIAAKRFTERAIAAGLPLGSGTGPVDPGWDRYVSGER